MGGRRTSEWDVLNRFLTVTIGSHRDRGWSLGRARQAAFDGVWDQLADDVVPVSTRAVTDSNINSACVYELKPGGDHLYLSTVLPFFAVWHRENERYEDECPDWALPFTGLGFSFMASPATTTLSPYVDEEAQRRITYFELLFEWIEGSDGPSEHDLRDPWKRPAHH